MLLASIYILDRPEISLENLQDNCQKTRTIDEIGS